MYALRNFYQKSAFVSGLRICISWRLEATPTQFWLAWTKRLLHIHKVMRHAPQPNEICYWLKDIGNTILEAIQAFMPISSQFTLPDYLNH